MNTGTIEPLVVILPAMGYWLAWARALREKKDKYRSMALSLTFSTLVAIVLALTNTSQVRRVP
jgi:hypothetical protein